MESLIAKIISPFIGSFIYLLEKLTNPIIKKNFDFRGVKNIAIVLIQGIGNTVLFLPTLEIIEKQFSKSKIYIIANNENKELLSAYKNFIFLEYPSKASFYERLKFLLKTRRNNFDLVIYGYPNMDIWPTIYCFFIGGYRLLSEYKIGMYKNCNFLNNAGISHDENTSDVIQNLNLLKPLGMKATFTIPKLKIPSEVQSKIRGYFENHIKNNKRKKKICIHIGAGAPIKKWPINHFADLTRLLVKKHNYCIIIVGGKFEKDEINKYLKQANVPVINASGKSVIETASIIKECDLLVSNDSGPMHIAASVGTKVIALYGPSTNIKRTQPIGKYDIVLTLKLPCSPCIDKNKITCPLNTHFCLKGVTPSIVANEVVRNIKN